MRTIHKHQLTDAANTIDTYRYGRWLHVGDQGGQITVWREVDTADQRIQVVLHVVGTGHPVPDAAGEHIGSVIMRNGAFVFHVYADHNTVIA